MNFKKIFVCFLIFILLILFFPFNVHALVSDIKFLDIPSSVFTYISENCVEYNDDYDYWIHKYANRWSAFFVKKSNVPSDFKFYYYDDNGLGHFRIYGNNTLPCIRYDFNYDLTGITASSCTAIFGSGYWVSGESDTTNSGTCFYSTIPLYTDSTCTELLYSPVPTFQNPYIANTAENLSTGTFDTLLIMPGSLEDGSILGVKINKINIVQADIDNDGVSEECEVYETVYQKQLDNSFKHSSTDEYWYEIPFSQLGINFVEGSTYVIELVNDINKIIYDDEYILYQEIRFTIGGLTEEDKVANMNAALIASNNKTTEAIQNQTEVNKNIFSAIKDILDFINPWSDKFFGKIIVDLFVDAFKLIFIPSDNFFNDWFTTMNEWLGDRFGIVYFPAEVVLGFLNRFYNIPDTTNYIINIPELKLEFMGYSVVFLNSFQYDFGELLTNDTFKNIHDIYLLVVDVILYLSLLVLARNTFVDVFGGHYIDDAVHDIYDYSEFKKADKKEKEKSSRIGFRS